MSKKLLLADDSITIQKVIGITFANEDYDLTIVDNGDAALQKAQADNPDLILADVFMPGKNGYELCSAVKQDANLQNVPVLLLTGTFEPFDEEKAISSGANGWIAKPFESQALIEKVEELIGGATPQQPSTPAPQQPSTPAPQQPSTPAPQQPSTPAASSPDDWGDVSFEETPSSDEINEPPIFDDAADFIIDDGSGEDESDTSDVWGESPDTIEMAEPEVVAVEEPEQQSPSVSTAQPDPQADQPASAENLEARVAGLSDADLEKVVERVAGAVLERIAWEVVPDLAENLVKDEIRKLKQES